jgi:hypothetical protein
MKNAREHIARTGFMLQQFLRRAPGIERLRGRHPNAPAPSSVMPERGRPGNALGAVLSLALMLFALLGLLAAITGAYALTPKQLSASSLAGRPTKTPPPRRSPTPTTVPSPTATATPTPAPSPTFIATPTTRATVPASVAPLAKATTPSASGKPGGSQRPTPVSTPSTSSPSSPAVQQQEGDAFFPLVILSGIAAVALLVAIGLWLLRQWLLPVRKVKVPPSGAAPWQRVRLTSLPGNINSSGDRRQQLLTTDAFLPATRNSIPSRKGFSSPTSHFGSNWQAMRPTRQFLGPTRVKAIYTSGMRAGARGSSAILPGQNSQPMAPMSERGREKNAEEMP